MDTTTNDKTSTSKTLRLIELNVKSYGGIHEGADLIISFDKNKDKNIVGLVGDQGVGKTSALRAILTLLGHPEPDNAINDKDKTKNAELKFEKDDTIYTVKITKSAFSVTMEGKNGKSKMSSPKEAICKIIGKIALNPQELKNMSGKEQIKWLRGMSSWGPEQKSLEDQTLTSRKMRYDERTSVNRKTADLKKELIATGYFSWDEENKCLIATDKYNVEYNAANALSDDSEIKAKFELATQKRDKYNAATNRLAALEFTQKSDAQAIEGLRQQILDLQNKIKIIEEKQVTTSASIEQGKKFLEENAGAQSEYDTAQIEIMNIGENNRKKELVKSANTKFISYNESVDDSIKLTAQIDEYDNLHKELVKQFLPNVPGLDIVIPSTDEQREEGVYYNDKSMAMLSESEMWEWYIPVLETQNVGIVCIENLTSLGTEAVKKLNWFANERGGNVFYSAMKRDEEKLTVIFDSEIK